MLSKSSLQSPLGVWFSWFGNTNAFGDIVIVVVVVFVVVVVVVIILSKKRRRQRGRITPSNAFEQHRVDGGVVLVHLESSTITHQRFQFRLCAL